MLKRFTLAVGLLIILMMRKQEHWLLMEGWALITI